MQFAAILGNDPLWERQIYLLVLVFSLFFFFITRSSEQKLEGECKVRGWAEFSRGWVEVLDCVVSACAIFSFSKGSLAGIHVLF